MGGILGKNGLQRATAATAPQRRHAFACALGRGIACIFPADPLVWPGLGPKRQGDAVNRTELIDAVSGDTGLTRQQSEAAIDAIVYEITAGVRSGNPVRITGFGTFKLRERQARKGRNPQTGAPVRIKASKGIGFTPGVKLKADLNSRGALAKPKSIAGVGAVAPAKRTARAAAKAPAKVAPAKKTAAKATRTTAAGKTTAAKRATTR
jgi:DNA-binding protein HU-beta